MTKQYSIAFLILFLIPVTLFSQTVITGVVKNKESIPLRANVMVQAKGSVSISAFSMSNEQGNYVVTYKGTADTLIISVTGINIGKQTKTILNKQQQIDFIIEEKPLKLKEVSVVPDKITRTGDTLNYSVGAYTDQNDRVIGDVLKKMPGIEVSPAGTISYNGVRINKFYVENMDLLQGRYGIATRNIAVKDVATVQVMENHQPIKALRDKIISEQAAINLKLKEEAKGTLAVTGMAGIGYEPFLWNAELVSMFFGKKTQNMSVYKGNNSGNNVASEFRTHYDYERVYMNDGSMLSIQNPTTPPVPQKRYLYNHSNAITTNQLLKISKDTECTINAIYYNDRIEKEGYSIYEQYLPGDSILSIEEKVTTKSKVNNLELAMKINNNAENYYLNNAFNLKGSWNDDSGSGITKSNSGNMDEMISQYLEKPFFSVDNTLNLIKNVKNNSYKIYFSTGYGYKPHTLTVSPADYFGNGDLSSISQNILSRDFATVLRLSYGLKIDYVNMDYGIWGRVDLRSLDSELQGKYNTGNLMIPEDSLKNDLGYNNYQTGFFQSYTYQKDRLKATLSLPLTCYILHIDDRIPDKFTKYDKWIANPSIRLKYDLTHELDFSTGANYSKSFGDMNSAYTGYIMHSYRSLLRNTVERLFETHSTEANASISYRNVFEALFIQSGITYSNSWKNLLYGYDYQGIMRIKTTIDQPTKSEGYQANISIQKGLKFCSSTVRLTGNYRENKSEQLIQNDILNYRSEGYGLGGNLNFSPIQFASINYDVSWNKNKSYALELSKSLKPINSVSQDGKINLFPHKTVTINFNVEYNYNSATTNRYSTFADAGIKFKRKQLDLELECNNLFNTKQYVSASYSDISAYYYSYDLRPRSVLLKMRFKLK